MNITLRRTDFRSDGIFGGFFLEDGTHFCATLEHAYLIKANWMPKMAPGSYTCQRRHSPHFGYDVFEVMNVPNCTYIEIHVGNFQANSEGCVLIGETITDEPDGSRAITNSRVTFHNFMQMQVGLDTFQLTVL